jgi:hypothetical protein
MSNLEFRQSLGGLLCFFFAEFFNVITIPG